MCFFQDKGSKLGTSTAVWFAELGVGGRRSGGGSKLVQTGEKTSICFPVVFFLHPNNEDTKGRQCAVRCAVLSLRQDGNEIVDGGS
ncbi:hypothetical protein PHYPO_G00105130 [Pangasianodon hypophthalmus]|uniref:Uncharacterized protein n=1 Tax=Pangasianodon hypophthalmus TaxID=310915 RepID=A0A5N5PX42_PANHP|nr:hypothetical protein PHYPO_G00105130 [Pangasianodon hypophthalmus]